ncbi:MAG: universal stress protein, partial [Candidatus Eremiobacteraeota bacterium]|nr:universal stress protein [Candidatus Eremiobacteraeota bacterium]
EVLLGAPHEEILKFAEREQADVIVMGTHGRSGVPRFFVGSVAEAVLRQSHCPVIVAKDTRRTHVASA